MLAAVSRSAASLLRAGAPKAQQVIPALQAISKYISISHQEIYYLIALPLKQCKPKLEVGNHFLMSLFRLI